MTQLCRNRRGRVVWPQRVLLLGSMNSQLNFNYIYFLFCTVWVVSDPYNQRYSQLWLKLPSLSGLLSVTKSGNQELESGRGRKSFGHCEFAWTMLEQIQLFLEAQELGRRHLGERGLSSWGPAWGPHCWELYSATHRAPDPLSLAQLGWEFYLSARSRRDLGNFCSGPNSDQLGKIAWQSGCDRNLGREPQYHPVFWKQEGSEAALLEFLAGDRSYTCTASPYSARALCQGACLVLVLRRGAGWHPYSWGASIYRRQMNEQNHFRWF